MTLNPEDIARRTFAIEERGYDRDEVRTFLFEVAAAMRLALHGGPALPDHLQPAAPHPVAPTTETPREFLMELAVEIDPPTSPPPSPTSPPTSPVVAPAAIPAPAAAHGLDEPERHEPAAIDDPADTFRQLGAEVADVLRAAHDAVALMHQQAELEAQAIRERGEIDADEARQRAQTEGAWHVDRAKRVLVTAQEQAEGIIAEAEAQARAVLTSARDQAEEHAAQVASRARHHAEQIIRAERESLRRLHEAQAHVADAIDMLADAETRPVVDLTELRPNVRLGHVTVDMQRDAARDDVPAPNELAAKDPVARMVRAAVGRAVTGAAEHAIDDADQTSDGAPPPPAE